METQTVATVADVMNPKLLYIREGDRLSLTRAQILKFAVTAVPVLDDEHRPVGIVSLRDLAADPVRPSAPVCTVRSDQSVADAARVLAKADLHHLVVVDKAGIAVGMVSALDLLREFVGEEPRHPEAFSSF